MNDLAVSDINSNVTFVPYGKSGNFGNRIDRSFLSCVLVHGIGADVRHSVCTVFHLMAVGI